MSFVEYIVEDHIALIRMNRPERLNAVGPEMSTELRAALKRFKEDEGAWVGVLTGVGRAFCAGRDLKAQATSGTAPRPRYTEDWNIFGVPDTDKPLIAAINGFAIGLGWYMAAGCDIRVAADTARFGMGEIPTGLLGPYWFAVAEVLPWPIGAELTLLGEQVGADRLFQLGLLNEVVPQDQVLDAAMRWARKFLTLPPKHVRATKALMTKMRRIPDAALLEEEYQARDALNSLDDTREAAAAFAEHRQPVFKGV